MWLADSLVVIGLATVNLGTIQEADGPQEHVFVLRNDGTESARLLQGYTSCGCTTIAFSKDAEVQPGDSTSVTLRFNPRGKGGEFLETGTLVYGSRRKHLHLAMEGNCITSEETLLRQFPIRINDELRLTTDRYDLGVMRVGETKERNVVVLHRDEQDRRERLPITFKAEATCGKGLQHITVPLKTTYRDQDVTFNVTLDVIIR